MSDLDAELRAQAAAALCKAQTERCTNFDKGAVFHWAERGYYQVIPAAQSAPVTVEDNGFFALIVDAMAEADRAMRKFPQPNYVISKFAEESGEVVKAAIHCAEGRETAENVRGEMRQAIAMLYRLWVEGDQVHGLRALAGDKP